MVQLHQNLPLSKDVESILRTEVLVESTNLSCQFFMDCFVHERCIPQQKFAMMFLSKCVTHTVVRQGGMSPSGKAFLG